MQTPHGESMLHVLKELSDWSRVSRKESGSILVETSKRPDQVGCSRPGNDLRFYSDVEQKGDVILFMCLCRE